MPIEDFDPQQIKMWATLFPWSFQQHAALAQRQGRFAHYTSAGVAMSIVQNRRVWMRNARTMNDFMEIEHGRECLFRAYKSAAGERLKGLLNGIHEGLCDEVEGLFNGWLPDLQTNTFMTCFSEHMDAEDSLGRLSMWRAYGRHNGVALVFNNKPFLLPSDALNAYSSPVSYFSPEEFEEKFSDMVDGLIKEEQFIKSVSRELLVANLFTVFRFAVLCTKHPGFHEEREWRVIYAPNFQRSDYLEHSLETINGVPQQVCKIPLQNVPEQGFVGAELPELLDRIIIGPTDHGLTMYDAFREALEQAGVEDAGNKVVLSDIPIREQ